MADLITINANTPTTAVVSTDEISIDSTLQHLQRMKLGIGANNAWQGDLAFGQVAAASSLPVVIASDQDFIKAEDAVHGSSDKGIMPLAVRNDTIAALAGATGDYIPLTTDADGRLYASAAHELGAATTGNITANGQSITSTLNGKYGTAIVTFSAIGSGITLAWEVSYDGGSTYWSAVVQYHLNGSIPFAPTVFNAVVPDSTVVHEVYVLGATHFRIRATAYTSGTLTTRIVPVTGTMAPFKPRLEIANTLPVSISGTVNVTSSNGLSTDGYAHPGTALNTNSHLANFNGSTWDRVRGGTTNGLFVDVKQHVPGVGATNLGKAEDAIAASGDTGVAVLAVRDDVISSDAADGDYTFLKTNSLGELYVGGVANDAVDAGNPVKIGAMARATDPTAVADADRVNIMADVLGKVVQLPYAITPKHFQYAAASGGEVGTADVAIKAAGAAGVRNYVTSVDIVNQHASVDTETVIKDGATVIWRGYCRAGGGGYSIVFPTPLRGTAATAMNFANITTGAKVYVNARGYQAID